MRYIELEKWLTDHESESNADNVIYNIRTLQTFLKTKINIDIDRIMLNDESLVRLIHSLNSSRVFRDADRRVGHRYIKALEVYRYFLSYSNKSHQEETAQNISLDYSFAADKNNIMQSDCLVESDLVSSEVVVEEQLEKEQEKIVSDITDIGCSIPDESNEKYELYLIYEEENNLSEENLIGNEPENNDKDNAMEDQEIEELSIEDDNISIDESQSTEAVYETGELSDEQEHIQPADGFFSQHELDNSNTEQDIESVISDDILENNDSVKEKNALIDENPVVETTEDDNLDNVSENHNTKELSIGDDNISLDEPQPTEPIYDTRELSNEQDTDQSSGKKFLQHEDEDSSNEQNIETTISEDSLGNKAIPENTVRIEYDDTLADELAAAAIEESMAVDEDEVIKEHTRQHRTTSDTVTRRKREDKTPEEIIRRADFNVRPFDITLEEMESDKELTNNIIQQLKALKDAYGDSFPIGMIYISKEQYKKLLQVCNKYITERSYHSVMSTAYISLTLVWVPVYSMYDHNFWINYLKAVNVEDTYENRKYVQTALLKFCVNENLYFHYTAGQRQYVQTVFTHTVINKASLIADFDLVYSFFVEEMKETYDEKSIDSHIDVFVNAMIKDLDSSAVVEDTETAGIYRVDTAFKRAFKVFGSSMRVALKSMLYNICSTHYKYNNYSTIPVSFFYHYKSWMIAKTIEKLKNKDNTASDRKSISDDKSNKFFTKGTYLLETDQSYSLYIPSQEIEPDYAYLPIYLLVYSDGRQLDQYNRQLEVYGKFRFHTEPVQINLNRFESKLHYEIICDGSVLYSSGSKMYRDYIIFDSNFEEYTSTKLPKMHYYVLTHKESSWYAECEYSSYPKFDYIIYSLESNEDQIVTCNNKLIFDNIISESGIKLALPSTGLCNKVKASVGMERYEVYSAISYVDIYFNEFSESDVVFMCNDKIVDIAPLIIKRSETSVRVRIDELFDEKAFLSLSVRRKGSLKTSDIRNIILAKDMCYTLDKQLYYADRTALLEDIYAENISFDEIDFPYQYSFDKNLEMNVIGLADGIEITFSIKLPVIAWFYDDDINSLNGVNYFESSKLYNGSKLSVSAPFDNYEVIAVNDSGFEKLNCKGGLVDLIKYKTNSNEFTTIGLIDRSTKKEYPLFDLIHQPAIRDISVQIFDHGKRAIIDMSLLCGCSAEVHVTDENGKEYLCNSYNEDGSELAFIMPELPLGKYFICINMLEKDEFGFGSESKEVFKKSFVYGGVMEYLLKKKGWIQIKKCDINGHGQYKTVENFYLDNIRSEISGLTYHADAFFYFYNRHYDDYVKKYFKGANPVFIRIIEKKENSISLVITDNDYDGFLYEKSRHYLIYDTRNIKDSLNYEFPDHYVIDF